MTDSALQGMLTELCDDASLEKFKWIFTIGVVIFVLMLFWIPFVDRNSGTFVIVVINMCSATLMATVSGAFIWGCRRRKAGQSTREKWRRRL